MNGVVFIAVVHVVVEVFVERGSFHLPVSIGNGDDLMLSKLHCSGLMDIDMATAHANDTLILVKHRVNGSGIGLGTTRQEEYLGIGHAAGFADTVFGSFAELVETVRRRLGIVVFHQIVYHLLTGTVVVITFKGEHGYLRFVVLLWCKVSIITADYTDYTDNFHFFSSESVKSAVIFVNLHPNLFSASEMTRLKTAFITFFYALSTLSLVAQETIDIMPPAPDYGDASQWYIHDQNGVADIFYVISTETGDHMEGADTCHFANTKHPLQREQMLVEMAAVDTFYTGKLNYYSPYYRQVSMDALTAPKRLPARMARAIDDVKASWQYYLEHFNQGRPFIMAGYSQGAAAVLAIMKEMPDSIAQRMVASYIIGFRVTAGDLDDIHNLRPARGAMDVGVTVCFNSVASSECELDVVSGGNLLCINPVNWRTDTISTSFIYDLPPVKDTLSVACDPEHHLLIVKGFKEQEILPVIGMPGNYHNYELRFYYPFIRQNIADRVAAYQKAVSRTPSVKEEILEDVTCAAGVNRAYVPAVNRTWTPAPDGKSPFAIITYGRHGSCYLSKPADYDAPLKALAKADSIDRLTPLGKNVLDRLKLICRDARNHWGELSETGDRQQWQIAWRLIERVPEIFNKDAFHLGARSLRDTRSLLSMDQLLMQVARECRTRVYHNASNGYSGYLNRQEEGRLFIHKDSLAKAAFEAFSKKYGDGDRLAKTLFSDPDYIRDQVDVQALSDQLFKIAGSIQNTRLDGKVSLYDLFTKEEIWHQWKKRNAWNYVNYGNYARQTKQKEGLEHRLLRRLLTFSDTAQTLGPTAVFHIADETSFLPLVSLMEINGYGLTTDDLETIDEKGWADYRICPMSANLQWILYRKDMEDQDVLIKVLLNDQEAVLPLPSENAPYYHVRDFKDYYLNKLGSYEK